MEANVDEPREDSSAEQLRVRRPWPRLLAGCAAVSAALHASGSAAEHPSALAVFATPVAFACLVPRAAARLGGPGARTGSGAFVGVLLSPLALGAIWIAAALALGAAGIAPVVAPASAIALLAGGALALTGARRAMTSPSGAKPRANGSLGVALALALVVGALAVQPWRGGGPGRALPSAGAATEPSTEATASAPVAAPDGDVHGDIDERVLERLLAAAHAERALARGAWPAGDPQLTGAAARDRAVAPSWRAALGHATGLGPLALGGVEALWLCVLVGWGAAQLARGGRSGATANAIGARGAVVAAAVLFGPAVPRLVLDAFGAAGAAAADSARGAVPLVRLVAGDERALALGLAFTGLVLWRLGREREGSRRSALPGLPLAVAGALDPWIGAVALATAALASLRGPRPLDRLLVLALAALPLVALTPLTWPEPTPAPGGFVVLAPLLLVGVVALAAGRSVGAATQRERLADLRLVLAALVATAVASSWAGGSAATDALALGAFLAVALAAAARPGLGVTLALVGLVASAGDLADAVALGRARGPFVDAGPSVLAVRTDPAERVAAAWAGAPPPRVHDPSWVAPIDVAERHAADWAALWSHLATDPILDALDPALIVEPGARGPRYAGGARVALDSNGAPIHEGVLLSGRQPFVVRPYQDAVDGVEPTPRERIDALEALLVDDALVPLVARRRLLAAGRGLVVPVGPEQRARLRSIDARLEQMGARVLWRRGEVTLFGLPASAFTDVPPLATDAPR